MKKFTLLFAMLIGIFSSAWADEVAIDRSSWTVAAYANPTTAIEGSGDGRKEAMLDGSSSTYFHSAWTYKPSNQSGNDATQAFLIDMAQEETLTKIDLLPRSNGAGAPLTWRIYVYDKDATPVDLTTLTSSNVESSLSEATLGAPTLSGTWEDNANLKTATFTEPVTGRYILFVADDRHESDAKWLCVAEFNAYKDASTYNITYDFYIDETKVGSSNPIVVEAGAAYPNIQLPSTMTCSADYYTLSAKPAGTVTADETVNITITQNTPFSISDSYANAKWYTIANHTNGYYLNYESGSSSMTLNRTTTEYADEDLFCFVGNVVEGFKIYNKAAGDGYLLSSAKSTFDGNTGGNTYAIMTAEATAVTQSYLWDITKSSNIEGAFYIGQHNNNSGKNRLNRRDSKLAYWNSGADAGSSFVVSRVYGSAAYTLLYNTIESAVIGTDPGYFPQSAVDAATSVLNDPNSSDADYEQAKNTLDAAMIMPEEGKTYQLISANPAFEQKQGHKKAIYDNGTQMRWGQLNAESRSFYWTFTASDNQYILQNVGTGRYPGVQAAQNVAVPSQEESNSVTLASLGSAQFNITATGCGAAMHTMGHNAGAGTENFICIWDAGLNTGSAWYIVEAVAPSVDLVALEAAIATAEGYQGHIGTGLGQYQGLTAEALASAISAAQGVLTSMNQEEVDAATAALNTEIGKLTINMPTAGQYMRIKGSYYEQYIGNGNASNGKYSRTEDEAEALVYFDGTTLRNVSTGKYYAVTGSSWDWADTKENAQTVVFDSKLIGKYTVNCGERYLYDADGYVDRGSELPETTNAQYPRYTSWILEDAEASAANMRISAAGWATFWAPFAVEVPAGVKAYTGELVNNSWVRMIEQDGIIPANTGVVVAGEELNADLAPIDPQPNLASKESCYTGNNTGKVMNVPAGAYLLQKNLNTETNEYVVGWYKVEGEGFTLAPNRCYLTVPDPNSARPFIGFEPVDDATGISSIATEAKTKADGKYMVKGQIVVVKAGKAYNMNGTEIK